MSQASRCFRQPVADKIVGFKRRIAGLRMAFAKQEYEGWEHAPIGPEASIAAIDIGKRDMLFEVRGTIFSARDLVGAFASLIRSITLADVLHRHGWRE